MTAKAISCVKRSQRAKKIKSSNQTEHHSLNNQVKSPPEKIVQSIEWNSTTTKPLPVQDDFV